MHTRKRYVCLVQTQISPFYGSSLFIFSRSVGWSTGWWTPALAEIIRPSPVHCLPDLAQPGSCALKYSGSAHFYPTLDESLPAILLQNIRGLCNMHWLNREMIPLNDGLLFAITGLLLTISINTTSTVFGGLKLQTQLCPLNIVPDPARLVVIS